MQLPPGLDQCAKIVIDSYFIIDMEQNIVEFNRAFYSMLPRSVARTLKTKKCYEVLQLDVCQENCIARECWRSGSQVRLDENQRRVIDGDRQRFILSAIPSSTTRAR